MSNQRIPSDIVRAGFGNIHSDTCITAHDLICLLLGSELSLHTSELADHVTIIISFAVVLLRRSLAPNCSRPNRFIYMILKRIFKMLPSNLGVDSIDIDPQFEIAVRYIDIEPHTGVNKFSFAVNRNLAPCLRGEIRLSFSETMHALSIIQKHMLLAYEKYSEIVDVLLEEEEQRSWRLVDTGCCPYERLEKQIIYRANENLDEFQRRFSSFIEECYFYYEMQIKRSFSQLQLQ